MLLEAREITYRYSHKSPYILKDVSLRVEEGERLGVVSPSGYGKTTLMKILAGYIQPERGCVFYNPGSSNEINNSRSRVRNTQSVRSVQLIGQHPEQAVNPRWRMSRVLQEACGDSPPPNEMLDALGIAPQWLQRYPRELSGGELQRFCVARALCAHPRFLLADEISTMLDVITQAQIWQYLLEWSRRENMGIVMVTHNTNLAERVCTRQVDLRDINELT